MKRADWNRTEWNIWNNAWFPSIGLAWRLIGWVLEQGEAPSLADRLLDENRKIDDDDRFALVLAALALAVLEEAYQHDASPGEEGRADIPFSFGRLPEVSLADVAENLGRLPDLIEPNPDVLDQHPNDLWGRLATASAGDLAASAELAGEVLAAHIAAAEAGDEASNAAPVIADRLPHCVGTLDPYQLGVPEGRRTANARLWIR